MPDKKKATPVVKTPPPEDALPAAEDLDAVQPADLTSAPPVPEVSLPDAPAEDAVGDAQSYDFLSDAPLPPMAFLPPAELFVPDDVQPDVAYVVRAPALPAEVPEFDPFTSAERAYAERVAQAALNEGDSLRQAIGKGVAARNEWVHRGGAIPTY